MSQSFRTKFLVPGRLHNITNPHPARELSIPGHGILRQWPLNPNMTLKIWYVELKLILYMRRRINYASYIAVAMQLELAYVTRLESTSAPSMARVLLVANFLP